MPLVETEGLVIKTYNLAEADRIVVFLTRDHGVVRGVAKGAKRLKSKFGSGLEPFSVVNLTYFQKEAVELVSIQKADLVRSYFAAASEPDFLQKFSYLGDLLAQFSPPHDPNETLYRMARACLEATADAHANLASVGVYFEIWLLRLAGYLPDWSRCDECKRVLDDTETADVRANFHLICGSCRKAAGQPADGAQRKLYASAMKVSPANFAAAANGDLDAVHRLSATLKRIIAQAIGRESVAEKPFAFNN
jgi:DNA repair protein RecO (recombination protein O)